MVANIIIEDDSNSAGSLAHIKHPEKVLNLFEQYQNELQLPDEVVEEAIEIFDRVTEARDHPGRGFASTTAASIRLACQLHDVPITIDAVRSVGGIDTSTIHDEQLDVANETSTFATPIESDAYLTRLIDELDVGGETAEVAWDHLDELNNNNRFGSPPAQAAGALWAAVKQTGGDVTQQSIAAAVYITPITVRTNAELVEDAEIAVKSDDR